MFFLLNSRRGYLFIDCVNLVGFDRAHREN